MKPFGPRPKGPRRARKQRFCPSALEVADAVRKFRLAGGLIRRLPEKPAPLRVSAGACLMNFTEFEPIFLEN